MHAPFGNSQLGTGYACLMPKLVSDWREVWSKNSGTPADAPFGLVTLAASGGEGGADIGSMRLAQTGSYGVMPNPAMENTFLAQAGDLDDPVSSLNCYHSGCCTNMSASPSCTEGIGCDKICHGGSTPDYSWEDTPVCKIVILSPFCVLSVSLIQKVSLFQTWGRFTHATKSSSACGWRGRRQ